MIEPESSASSADHAWPGGVVGVRLGLGSGLRLGLGSG